MNVREEREKGSSRHDQKKVSRVHPRGVHSPEETVTVSVIMIGW